MSRLTWGILGTGNIAKQFATGILASQRSSLTAVGSRSLDSAKTFTTLFPCTPPCIPHGSYEKLLADPSYQALYLSLPNSMHHEWTLKALNAGKHVLCEKPFASTLAQAEEMFDLAKKKGLLLMEAFMYRSHPQTLAIQKLIAEGAIGELRYIRASFLYHASKIEGSIKFDPKLHGGSLMDVGCYPLSYARLFAGTEPTTISSTGHIHPLGVDDYCAGILTFPNNIFATFACGITVRADNTTSLMGTLGHIDIPVPWKPPVQNATFYHSDKDGQVHTHLVSAEKALYALEADDFAAAVLDAAPLRVSRADTLGNQKTLDTIRQQIGLPY